MMLLVIACARGWVSINKRYYDPQQIAIVPMSFSYLGKGETGDLAPMKICAETWRAKLLEALPEIQLTLIIGQYAINWHLANKQENLTKTVGAWADCSCQLLPLLPQSPGNNIWLKKSLV